MDKVEEIVVWGVSAVVTAMAAIVGWMYRLLNGRVEKNSERIERIEKSDIATDGRMDQMQGRMDANYENLRNEIESKHKIMLQEVRHIREILER